jgi:type VI secretion system protein ImpK
VRPRPGAGRRPVAPDGTVAWHPAAAPSPDVEPLPAAAMDVVAGGLNPLVQAATPLLLLAGRLRGTLAGPDVGTVRQHTMDEIRRFEQRAQSGGVSNEFVLAARYALAATLDEAVLSTPWGAQSEWTQQSLLVVLHRETWGGEKFFDMLERASRDVPRHIDLLELLYLCMAVGFAGRYLVRDRGHAQLAEVQRQLYQRIREHRGAFDPALSLRWQGVQDRRNRLIRYVPWWLVGAGALAVLAITFVLYSSALRGPAGDIQSALIKVGTEGFDAAPRTPVVVHGPTLKQLLAPEEAGGSLKVDEQNGRTVVTLPSAVLFASGSATIDPRFDPILQRVAEAIARVPGRVLVVGHTDDQPLRSMRYADNYELSRERARNVVEVLQRQPGTAGRLQWQGAGPSQPVAQGTDAESRARNRRVEIIHIPG